MSALLLPSGSLAEGAAVDIPPDEAHHLRVRRATDGEQVRLIDGAGRVGLGVLEQHGSGWRALIEHVNSVPPAPALVIAVGGGDRERFGLIVEKATELGATDIVAVDTHRSRSVAGRVRPEHVEKLAGRALASLKQSGGAWLPRVRGPVAFEDALRLGIGGRRWLASVSDEQSATAPRDGPMAILVGPEGGFSTSERDAALLSGWEPVRLARGTLRFETAAIVAVALVAAARAGRKVEERHE